MNIGRGWSDSLVLSEYNRGSFVGTCFSLHTSQTFYIPSTTCVFHHDNFCSYGKLCHFSVKESHVCLLNHAWLFSWHRVFSCLGEEPSLTVTKAFIGQQICPELLLTSSVLTHCYHHFNLITSFVQTMKIQTMNSLNE